MPLNGSGTYTLPSPQYPAVSGTLIEAAKYNAILADIRDALSTAIFRDGQAPYVANQAMAGFKFTGLGAGTAENDSLRWQQLFSQGLTQDIASAATTNIGAANTTNVRITGTTTITSFGTNYNGPRFVTFEGALTLTDSATLELPGSANIVTAAGDSLIAIPVGNPATGWRVVSYVRASGISLPDSVDTAALRGGVVTFAKMQNISAGVVLGRPAGTGLNPVQELNSAQITALLAYATDSANGVVELATSSEASTGTDTTKVLTPATLRNGLNASGNAPVYAPRAWVNFDGALLTPTIRGSGNVSSITDNGTADYTINFATALPDTNYAPVFGCISASGGASFNLVNIRSSGTSGSAPSLMSTTQLRVVCSNDLGTLAAAIFR